MKALLINGSPHKEGCTYRALYEVKTTLESEGFDTEIIHIGTDIIGGCTACGACAKTGKCIIDDIVNVVAEKLDSADAIIIGSPVYYANPTGQIISFLDRLFYANASKLRGKVGASVVTCRRGGATASFDVLNKYFTIASMPVATSCYWNMVHGANNTPSDVEKDEEGIYTMQVLGKNVAWLAKCIRLGAENGVPIPPAPKKVRTNYIR